MPETINFSFGPDTKPNKLALVSDSRLINAYVEPQSDAKGGVQYVIHGDPGLTQFVDSGLETTRGSFLIGSTLYTVFGEKLYKVSSGGALTEIGTVAGSKAIIAAVNRASPPQVVIVADTAVYQLEADVLQTFQDGDLIPGVVSVDYMDGYFILYSSTGLWQISGLDALTVAALDVAETDVRSDIGVRGIVYEHRLWFFGGDPERATVEEWINTGNAVFPFERSTSFVESGALSKHAIVIFDNTLAFIDCKGRVVRLQGYQPSVISSPAVERDIRRTMTAQSTDEIEAFVYFEAGHEFWQISGPDWTWVYDAATQLWHQKESYGLERSRHRTYIRAFDKHLVGDSEAGILYELTDTVYDEDGDYLIVKMRTANQGPWPARVRWHNLIIDMEMGVGDGSTSDHTGTPDAMMRFSDDGGNIWSNEFQAEMGAIGEHRKRLKFNRLGISGSQGRMFELAISAGVRRTTINASALVEVLVA